MNSYSAGPRVARAPLGGPSGAALGFGAAVAAVLLGGLAGDMFGWAAREPVSLVLLALAALLVGAVTTVAGAVAAAVQGWAVYSGFVVNRLGELRMAPADRSALLVLLAVAVLAGLVATAMRSAGAPARRRSTGWRSTGLPPELTVGGATPVRVGHGPGGHRGSALGGG